MENRSWKDKWSLARKVMQPKNTWPFSRMSPADDSPKQDDAMHACHLISTGRTDYKAVWELQKALVQARHSGTIPETLILTEHDPVITFGRRAEEKDVLVTEEVLDQVHMQIYKIERGGLVTYHGPGQLVAYPVFRLRELKLGVVEFVARLENVILAVLEDFGITGQKRKGHPGVWADGGKIASIGLAVRRGITFHGLALNCDPDLSHFNMINPCGLIDEGMTSMTRERGRPVDPDELKVRTAHHFSRIFHLEMDAWSLSQAAEMTGLPGEAFD